MSLYGLRKKPLSHGIVCVVGRPRYLVTFHCITTPTLSLLPLLLRLAKLTVHQILMHAHETGDWTWTSWGGLFYWPIPYSRDVVSQPRIAWLKSKFLQIAGPSCSWTARMFRTRGLYCLSWFGKAFCYASKNSTARLPGGSYVFVDTESVGIRRTHPNILVWRVVGHATASRADAGPCIFN